MAKKRVEAESNPGAAAVITSSMVRARDGSAFARCEECNKDVPAALISFHSCSLDAKIKMNLEAQVLEKTTEIKKKPAERKKSTAAEPKAKKAKKSSDPNKPKRPPTAFFIFLDEFRKTFKAANPGSKDVKRVAKDAGEKWKSLADEEKKPYIDKQAELKAEYDRNLKANSVEDEEVDGDSEEGAEEVPDQDEEGLEDEDAKQKAEDPTDEE